MNQMTTSRLIWTGGLRLFGHRVEWHCERVPLTIGESRLVHLLASRHGVSVSNLLLYATLLDRPAIAQYRSETDWSVNAAVRTKIKRIRQKFRTIDPAFDEIVCTTRGYFWLRHSIPDEASQ